MVLIVNFRAIVLGDYCPNRREFATLSRMATESDAARLARAIELSGLSARKFAKVVLVRDERTVRRWLAGDSPVPSSVREKVAELLAQAGAAEAPRKMAR